MKINPMLKKEIMVNVRGIKLTILMLIFNLVLAMIGLVVFGALIENARWNGSMDYGATISFYIMLLVIQAFLLVFLIPAMTAGTISGERERQTLEILLSSDLSPGKIVFGKLSSSLLSVILMLLSSLPVMSLVFIFGGVGIWQFAANVLFLMYIALFIGIIGVSCSAISKKTASATAASYGLIMLIGLGTLIIALLMIFLYELMNWSDWLMWPPMLLLLANPGSTMLEILTYQTGGEGLLSQAITLDNHPVFNFVTGHWTISSLLVQVCIMAGLLRSAVKRVNPLYTKRKKKK